MDFSDRSSTSSSALQKGANQQFQNDIIRLDNDCEHIQGLIKEGENPLNYQQVVQIFLERNKLFCSQLIKATEFKNSFFVYRKLEKVLLPLLKQMEMYDDQNFPLKNINQSFAQQILDIDTTKISKLPTELVVKKLPQKYLSAYDFSSNILSNIVSCFNNQGTIYMLRGKVDVALNCYSKALEGRLRFLNSYQHHFQLSILFLNIAFCYKNKENYEESSKLLNKAILMLENIEKISKEFAESDNLVESSSFVLCLIEMLYNKNEKDYRDEEVTQRQKLLYFLSISYNYYGELLSKLQKAKESEFCKKQSEVLFKQFRKRTTSNINSTNNSMHQLDRPSSRSGNSIHQNIKNQESSNQNMNQIYQDESKMDDNFSQASFQTVNTTQSYAAFGGQNISKDNIIFQKYIKLSEIRYKIIILQIKEYNCVQIILYNKPNNFLSKIIVGFQELIDYSIKIKMSNAFIDQDQLNEFFKELSRRLQIEKGQLKIRDMEYYNSIEDFTKYTKVLPPNLTNLTK
ncbi:hypothetical protein ABPG73_022649 [Tetrahymena malaccensis]